MLTRRLFLSLIPAAPAIAATPAVPALSVATWNGIPIPPARPVETSDEMFIRIAKDVVGENLKSVERDTLGDYIAVRAYPHGLKLREAAIVVSRMWLRQWGVDEPTMRTFLRDAWSRHCKLERDRRREEREA